MARSIEDELDLVDDDNYYAWLGLSKDATKEEINNSYRKLSRIYHPDKHASNPATQEKAQNLFTKIKKAHEVLSDPHTRAIYDTTGVKGLETEGWQVISRTKSPKEILEEYERLKAEREERKLQQQTNPKGSMTMSIDAMDWFDNSDDEDSSFSRSVEIGEVSISQSVECPLTPADTVVIGGSVSTRNGRGQGGVSAGWRRILSHRSWAEVEMMAGSSTSATVTYFRTFWTRGFMNLAGTLHVTERGFRPGLSCGFGYQLRQDLQGRITWQAGVNSMMNSALVWENPRNSVSTSVQLGILASFVSVSYARKFVEREAKLKTAIKFGTFGFVFEYGCEKKVTQFSTLGATMAVGTTFGIMLKIKLVRGNNSFTFPIRLSESTFTPSALIYGTALPIIAYYAVKMTVVMPFIKEYRSLLARLRKERNLRRITEKRKEAEAAVELMKETYDRSYAVESVKGGLVIKKALYGKLHGENVSDAECIDVTRPLQALVADSRLIIPGSTELSQLPGFYDPCDGDEAELTVIYDFRRQRHAAKFKSGDKIVLPSRDHLNDLQQVVNNGGEGNSSQR